MKGGWLSFLLQPYVLALVPAWVIVILLPDLFSRYNLQVYSEDKIGLSSNVIRIRDLDGDGKREFIRIGYNGVGQASFQVRRYDKSIVGQWNIMGDLIHASSHWTFYDINDNGCDDFFFISYQDSLVYLRVFDFCDTTNGHIRYEVKLIDDFHAKHENDLSATPIIFSDLDQDDTPELVFGLNAGFSVYPRNLFVVNLESGRVTQLPYFCNRQSPKFLYDWNNDGQPEIFSIFSSSANDTAPIDTSCSDRELRFATHHPSGNSTVLHAVDGYEFGSHFPSLFIQGRDTTPFVVTNSGNFDKKPHSIAVLTPSGLKEVNELAIRNPRYLGSASHKFHYILDGSSGTVYALLDDFKLSPIASIPKGLAYLIPINSAPSDMSKWVALSMRADLLYVFEHDFSSYASISIPIIEDSRRLLDYYYLNDTLHVYAQRQDMVYDYTYTPNPYYHLKYPFYLGIYLAVAGFLWLLARGQQYQQRKKEAMERDMATLQMKTIKNQVDPHFVFNAINSMSSMVLADDKEEADRFITRLSRFMRQTLHQSDRIVHSLEDEIQYVDSFLQLQQIRFQQRFAYTIQVDTAIDTTIKVPKHILFTYVENAIKHGLSHKNGAGTIRIDIEKQGAHVKMMVEDNGVGEAAKEIANPLATGKGLQIMERIIALYKKLYGKNIGVQRIPLTDDQQQPTGMRVVITLQ